MPRHARSASSTGIYHIVMRGINKQQIFEDDKDTQKFLSTISKFKKSCAFEIYAYCLMGNHIHILMKEGDEPIGDSVKRISSSYVYWYNWRYERNGHLFQNRFLSEPIDSDEYLTTVIRYIHQNPVAAGICKSPKQYKYSSYGCYLRGGNGNDVLVDADKLLEIVDVKTILDVAGAEESHCLDMQSSFRNTDKYALSLIKEISGCSNVTEFQALDKSTCKQYLAELRAAGLSIRQLSRLTGISFGIVRNCT